MKFFSTLIVLAVASTSLAYTSKKRMLLWDYTNTNNCPWAMKNVWFGGPMSSVSNWNAWYPPELAGRAPFRPMIHLLPQLSGSDWNSIQNSDQPIIMYFNEPERAGISPEQAASLWHSQVLSLRTSKGKKLVSPSCASDDAGMAWIDKFMSLVSDSRPDYLGLHYYGSDGNAAIQYIQMMRAKYNLPIIVSEIASTASDHANVLGFTAQLANWMDNTDYIFEYGFFGCMEVLPDTTVNPAAQLMNHDGSFTDLMYKLEYDQPIAYS